MSENKKYTQDMFEASYATYEPTGRVVDLIDSFESMSGQVYWICKDDKLEYPVNCEDYNLVDGFR